MKNNKIIYYVAVTLDGFIAGSDGNIDAFKNCDELNAHYFEELKKFQATIMGRKTYEFGYRYGLSPGKKAYPHMDHYIFSSNLNLDSYDSEVEIINEISLSNIKNIKDRSESNIYLCGGADFATKVYKLGLIDEIWLKINPVILGDGIRFLNENISQSNLCLNGTKSFKSGILELRYEVLK